jgi:signal transduction histidine kinase
MIELVNSLLDLSKMEAGMMAYEFTPTELAALVKKSLAALGPLAEAKNITIANRVASLPQVNADQERILQVLRNLIGNAIKFTPDNGIIEISAAAGKDAVEVAVQDSGIGIAGDELERIFRKFQQIVPAGGKKTKGTGLGLATVKQIIRAHGGEVWATSRAGEGSTFYFTLPLAA